MMAGVFGCVSAFKRNIPFNLLCVRTYVPLLRPRQTKYKKFHLRLRCFRQVGPNEVVPKPTLNFHKNGVYALQSFRMTAAQIEAARLTLVRTIGRKGSKIRINVFPHIPVTKKSIGTRMGNGKGNVDHFVAFVKAGKILFEYDCDNYAKQAYKAMSYKLPIKIGYVTTDSNNNN